MASEFIGFGAIWDPCIHRVWWGGWQVTCEFIGFGAMDQCSYEFIGFWDIDGKLPMNS
jgi:hypothetical protein